MADFKIKATTNTKEFRDGVKSIAKRCQYANVIALTRVANAVKDAEYDQFKRKFDRPTPFTMNSLYIKPATLRSPVAETRTKDGFGSVPAGRYLDPEVEGGVRRQKSTERKIGSYIVPSKYMTLDAYGNVPGSVWRKMLSNIQVGGQDNVTDSKRSKAKRRKEGYFLRNGIIFRRNRQFVEGKVLYAIIPQFILIQKVPHYSSRIDWYGIAQKVFDERYYREFENAFSHAAG